jgi:hypothetical protein
MLFLIFNFINMFFQRFLTNRLLHYKSIFYQNKILLNESKLLDCSGLDLNYVSDIADKAIIVVLFRFNISFLFISLNILAVYEIFIN